MKTTHAQAFSIFAYQILFPLANQFKFCVSSVAVPLVAVALVFSNIILVITRWLDLE